MGLIFTAREVYAAICERLEAVKAHTRTSTKGRRYTVRPFTRKDELTKEQYAKLKAPQREQYLIGQIQTYKDVYTPRAFEYKSMIGLSEKSKQTWVKSNTQIGMFEGKARAYLVRGWKTISKERRKWFHGAITMRKEALKLRDMMEALR